MPPICQASGQVYTETTTSVQSMVPAWTAQSTGKKINPATYRNPGPGSSSLRNMTLRSCAWYINDFTPETFENVDWPIAEEIYKRLKETLVFYKTLLQESWHWLIVRSRDTFTVKAWSIFRTSYPSEATPTYHIRIASRRGSPPIELPAIITRTSTLSFSCLTFLSVQHLALQKMHLMSLLPLTNLAVLHLSQNPTHIYESREEEIDDKFMRDWGRAVHEKQTFQNLKVS